jgi:hypothetical protein
MTDDVLQNLPSEYTDLTVRLHQKASEVTPYDHIAIDWMPNGHPPAYFQLSHFDIHFYMMPVEDQMMIPAPTASNTSLSSTSAFGRPSPGILPADYTVASAAVPMMGRHWLDKNASVLPPTNATFTYQFIYGTFDNKVVFLEPMVTRAFLFKPTGTFYPTRYNIFTDSDTRKIYISLDQFVWR